MKQVKIAYAKCRAKMPNRPPDEIDFGLGFRAALKWVKKEAISLDERGDVNRIVIDRELES